MEQKPIMDHQIAAIRGSATMMGYTEVLEFVKGILGLKANYLKDIQDLTYGDAVKVLDYVRKHCQEKEHRSPEERLFSLEMRLHSVESMLQSPSVPKIIVNVKEKLTGWD